MELTCFEERGGEESCFEAFDWKSPTRAGCGEKGGFRDDVAWEARWSRVAYAGCGFRTSSGEELSDRYPDLRSAS